MFGFNASIPTPVFVETEEQAQQWLQYYLRAHDERGSLGLDSETTGLNKLRDRVIVWSLSDKKTRICIPAKFLPVFKEQLLENPRINFDFTNAPFDAHMFANSGVDLSKAGEWRDTRIQSFLLNENNLGRHGLKECVKDHFDREMPEFSDVFGKVPPRRVDKVTGRLLSKTVADLIYEAFSPYFWTKERIYDLAKSYALKEWKKKDGEAALEQAISLKWQFIMDRYIRAIDYSALDAYSSTELREYFDERLSESRTFGSNTLRDYYYRVEVPFTKLLWKLERRGITVDRGYLMTQAGPMQAEMDEITREFTRAAGRLINCDALADMRWFFFEYLHKVPMKFTEGGENSVPQPSLDFDTLDEWAGKGDRWAQLLLRYREISKAKGTYVDGLQDWLDPEYRIHTSLNQTGAVTMRLSSSQPNLQNIPRPGEDRFKIRDAFIHGPNSVLLVADYEQLEMRLMAHFSQDQKMINAIKTGTDLHCLTVAEMYGIPYDEVMAAKKAEKKVKEGTRAEPLTPREEELLQLRQAAKATGFGIIYGIGGAHLAANLTKDLKRLVTEEEGFSLIRKWFGVFPGAKAYIDRTKDDLYRNDKVQTIVGRYRRFGNMKSMTKQDAKRAERQAVNSIIQGTASDIAKSAMLQCEHDPELNAMGVVLLLQIHDELIFECPDDPEIIKKAKKRVEEIMCSPFVQELLVPIPAAAGAGHTWSSAK